MPEPSFLQVAPDRRLAYHRVEGKGPTMLFCGGYTSDMAGTKALALERWCRAQGRAFVRFDYGGHGQSDGFFEDGTIGSWAEDALAIVDRVIAGPLIVVGSSMGGWIMLLVALARPERVRALLGIAAAPDFTEDLLLPEATEAQRRDLERQGFWMQPSAYGPPYPVTARLIEDGRRHLLLRAPDRDPCPVHLLHGQRDPDVPWQTALRLAERLQSEDVTVELIKAGDHRLSTEADLARITAALARLDALRPAAKESAPDVREKGADDQRWVDELLQERWGGRAVIVHGVSYDAATLRALVAGQREGLATYRIDGDRAELITLDARSPGRGTGTALIAALMQKLEGCGVRELCVTTTNDNLGALRFYQRRGFRIAGVRCGAVDDARRHKPSISELGQHGIPIRDEIELRLQRDARIVEQGAQPLAIARIAQVDGQLLLDPRVADPAAVAVEAARHRRQLGRLERHLGRRQGAQQRAGEGDHVLRRRRLVVGDVVDRAGIGPRHRGAQHLDDVVDVDAAEHLAGLDDAARGAGAHRGERAAARPGAVDAGEAEQVHRQAARQPVRPRRAPGAGCAAWSGAIGSASLTHSPSRSP